MTADPIALARVAADAIGALCATLDDCAAEVEGRGGKRVARGHLLIDAKGKAVDALDALWPVVQGRSRVEVNEIAAAVVNGYVRPWMALRVVAIATEAARVR